MAKDLDFSLAINDFNDFEETPVSFRLLNDDWVLLSIESIRNFVTDGFIALSKNVNLVCYVAILLPALNMSASIAASLCIII